MRLLSMFLILSILLSGCNAAQQDVLPETTISSRTEAAATEPVIPVDPTESDRKSVV